MGRTVGHTCFAGRDCKEAVSHHPLLLRFNLQTAKFFCPAAQLSSFRRFYCHCHADVWHQPMLRLSLSLRQRAKHFQVNANADHVFPTDARSVPKAVRSPMHSMHSVHAVLSSIHSIHSVLVNLCHAVPWLCLLGSVCVYQTQYAAGPITVFQAWGTGPKGQTFRLYSEKKALCLMGERPQLWLRQGQINENHELAMGNKV